MFRIKFPEDEPWVVSGFFCFLVFLFVLFLAEKVAVGQPSSPEHRAGEAVGCLGLDARSGRPPEPTSSLLSHATPRDAESLISKATIEHGSVWGDALLGGLLTNRGQSCPFPNRQPMLFFECLGGRTKSNPRPDPLALSRSGLSVVLRL